MLPGPRHTGMPCHRASNGQSSASSRSTGTMPSALQGRDPYSDVTL
jgi:hypothetical protein